MNELTITETQRLTELEQSITAGLQTFVKVGNALAEIRDARLYRQTHGTFEDYCRERWGMTRRRAYQMIDAAAVVENVKNFSHPPQVESHTAALTPLSPELQRTAWREAVETAPNGKVTAAHVESVVQQYTKPAPEPPPITPKAQNYITLDEWNAGVRWHGEPSKTAMNRVNENIEWAAWSWNPVTGCLHNCAYCYARDIANRFYEQKFAPSFVPERLSQPANTRPISPRWNGDAGHRNVFTCSMADLFGKWVPEEWIESVIQVARDNPQWTFLYLTKFPVRMAEFDYPDNVWLGTSVDRQHAVQRAESAFRKIKASGFGGICWLSCEPMLERLTFSSLDMFDWVVMGGASSSTQTPEYRPPFDDIAHLHYQARAAGCMIYQKTNLRIREYPKIK